MKGFNKCGLHQSNHLFSLPTLSSILLNQPMEITNYNWDAFNYLGGVVTNRGLHVVFLFVTRLVWNGMLRTFKKIEDRESKKTHCSLSWTRYCHSLSLFLSRFLFQNPLDMKHYSGGAVMFFCSEVKHMEVRIIEC